MVYNNYINLNKIYNRFEIPKNWRLYKRVIFLSQIIKSILPIGVKKKCKKTKKYFLSSELQMDEREKKIFKEFLLNDIKKLESLLGIILSLWY